MKKRRILSVLLCLALAVFSLSGCNKTSSKKKHEFQEGGFRHVTRNDKKC